MSVLQEIKRLINLFANRSKYPSGKKMGLVRMIWLYFLKQEWILRRERPVIEVPFDHEFAGAMIESDKIAVIVHCYYPELLEEIVGYISNISSYRLFISTDTEAKKKNVELILKKHQQINYEIRLSQNRGRDISAKYITFRDIYPNYQYFLQLHTKKSPHFGSFGDAWRKYLLNTLVGSREVVTSIITILRSPQVGLVYPEPLRPGHRKERWGDNFEVVKALSKKMDLILYPDDCPIYPSGSMFWGKPQAIAPLLALNLTFDDFSEERGQLDGTLAHALERIIVPVVRSQGLNDQQIAIQGHNAYSRVFKVGNNLNLDKVIKKSIKLSK